MPDSPSANKRFPPSEQRALYDRALCLHGNVASCTRLAFSIAGPWAKVGTVGNRESAVQKARKVIKQPQSITCLDSH